MTNTARKPTLGPFRKCEADYIKELEREVKRLRGVLDFIAAEHERVKP
jgi:hypothetical protein